MSCHKNDLCPSLRETERKRTREREWETETEMLTPWSLYFVSSRSVVLCKSNVITDAELCVGFNVVYSYLSVDYVVNCIFHDKYDRRTVVLGLYSRTQAWSYGLSQLWSRHAWPECVYGFMVSTKVKVRHQVKRISCLSFDRSARIDLWPLDLKVSSSVIYVTGTCTSYLNCIQHFLPELHADSRQTDTRWGKTMLIASFLGWRTV